MNTGNMPKHMTAITPFLTVKDIDAALEFYTTVFGFEKKYAMPGPGGKTVHAEVMHGGSTIMLGAESEHCGSVAPALDTKTTSFGLYLYVENVDKFFENAKKNNVTIKEEPQDMFWGDRMGSLVDPFGHHWSFGTFVREVSPEDCQKAMLEMMKQMTPA